MIMLGLEGATVRAASSSDQAQLIRLLQRKSFIHRHLGWHSPLFWLGSQPFYLLEDNAGAILAALACPPDESGLIWLRLFAAAPGVSPQNAWQRLWPAAKEWLETNMPGVGVASLAVDPVMVGLLEGAGFREINQVVSLVWRAGSARYPFIREELVAREMRKEDLTRVSEIDRQAFDRLWQNTLSQLEAAYQEAFYASVVLRESLIIGYQISTVNPQGGHLARLAVEPALQGQGAGRVLLDDLLDRFVTAGIVEVSVNTQADNYSSLALYEKFGFFRLDDVYPVMVWTLS